MIPINDKLKMATTVAALMDACTTSDDVVRFTINGACGCVLVQVKARFPTGMVVDQVHRYRLTSAKNLVPFIPEHLSREKRIPLVHAIDRHFDKKWIATFFDVSNATITNDLKNLSEGKHHGNVLE